MRFRLRQSFRERDCASGGTFNVATPCDEDFDQGAADGGGFRSVGKRGENQGLILVQQGILDLAPSAVPDNDHAPHLGHMSVRPKFVHVAVDQLAKFARPGKAKCGS